MPTATTADVARDFGAYRVQAQHGPVVVTEGGRPAVVILSASEYDRLRDLDRRILRLESMTDAELEELAAAEIPAEHRYSSDTIPD